MFMTGRKKEKQWERWKKDPRNYWGQKLKWKIWLEYWTGFQDTEQWKMIKEALHLTNGTQKPDGTVKIGFSSVAQSCPTLCDPMNRSTPGLTIHHQLPEFTQTHVHLVSDAIHPSHPLLSPSPLAPNPSQHQSLSQWVNSSHEVAKVLEFQL